MVKIPICDLPDKWFYEQPLEIQRKLSLGLLCVFKKDDGSWCFGEPTDDGTGTTDPALLEKLCQIEDIQKDILKCLKS